VAVRRYDTSTNGMEEWADVEKAASELGRECAEGGK